jgi:hypothetical protein
MSVWWQFRHLRTYKTLSHQTMSWANQNLTDRRHLFLCDGSWDDDRGSLLNLLNRNFGAARYFLSFSYLHTIVIIGVLKAHEVFFHIWTAGIWEFHVIDLKNFKKP